MFCVPKKSTFYHLEFAVDSPELLIRRIELETLKVSVKWLKFKQYQVQEELSSKSWFDSKTLKWKKYIKDLLKNLKKGLMICRTIWVKRVIKCSNKAVLNNWLILIIIKLIKVKKYSENSFKYPSISLINYPQIFYLKYFNVTATCNCCKFSVKTRGPWNCVILFFLSHNFSNFTTLTKYFLLFYS